MQICLEILNIILIGIMVVKVMINMISNTLDTDPGFINAANGDFTVTGASQLEKRTGDPRWLPLVEE